MIEPYQKRIDAILQPYEKPYWHPLSQLARIIEEVGEMARILNHKFGDKPLKAGEVDDLEDELGDVIYSLICLANSQSIDLDKAVDRAIYKMEVRDRDRFAKKVDTKLEK